MRVSVALFGGLGRVRVEFGGGMVRGGMVGYNMNVLAVDVRRSPNAVKSFPNWRTFALLAVRSRSLT